MFKKHYFILILLCITVATLTSCSQNDTSKDSNRDETTDTHSTQSTDSITDITDDFASDSYTEMTYILDINLENSTIMIGASMDTDYFMQTQVYLKENTRILINGVSSNLEDLSIGDSILITYTGIIAESAPAQMHHPTKIEINE